MPVDGQGSETPRRGYPTSRNRERLSSNYLFELDAWMRANGRSAIMRVGKTQPAALLKIIALTLPKEHKVEHTNVAGKLSDEQLSTMIAELEDRLAARAAGAEAKVINGTAQEVQALPKPKRNAMLAHADSPIAPKTARYRKAKPRAQAGGQSDSTPD